VFRGRHDPSPAADADAYRAKIRAGLSAGDWREVHDWTKGWVGQGGGAWLPEAWLAYAAGGILLGQPRTAVHSVDAGLSNWIVAEADRSILLWARGSLVMRRLADPKTALPDLTVAAEASPTWLAPVLAADTEACEAAAKTSRKRTPSVKPAPAYEARDFAHDKVAPSVRHTPGDQPPLWDELIPLLASSSRTLRLPRKCRSAWHQARRRASWLMRELRRGRLIALALGLLTLAVVAGAWLHWQLAMTVSDEPYHLEVVFAPHTSRPQAVAVQRDCDFAASVTTVSLHRGGVTMRRRHGRIVPYRSPFSLDFTLRHGPDATETDALLGCVRRYSQVASDVIPL
jgi:hypothetical protein